MSEYDSIEDADLLAYLDGQLDPETTNLINGSPALQQKARQLASLESGLHQHLFRIDCPEGMELAEYATGRLQHAQQQRVVAHLASCPHCRAEMRSIQQFIANTHDDLSPGLVSRLKVMVARLVSPGLGTPALSGVRGEGEGPRLFQAGELQISVEVQADPERPDNNQLFGLLADPTNAIWQAHLWQSGAHVQSTAVDPMGNFIFSALPPGPYELVLDSEGLSIHIQEI